MAEASILSEYSAEQAQAQRKAEQAARPLSLLGVAVAVFLGNAFTGVVAAIIYFLVK